MFLYGFYSERVYIAMSNLYYMKYKNCINRLVRGLKNEKFTTNQNYITYLTSTVKNHGVVGEFQCKVTIHLGDYHVKTLSKNELIICGVTYPEISEISESYAIDLGRTEMAAELVSQKMATQLSWVSKGLAVQEFNYGFGNIRNSMGYKKVLHDMKELQSIRLTAWLRDDVYGNMTARENILPLFYIKEDSIYYPTKNIRDKDSSKKFSEYLSLPTLPGRQNVFNLLVRTAFQNVPIRNWLEVEQPSSGIVSSWRKIR